MTANLSTRRSDSYGPIHPWKASPMLDAEIRDRIDKLLAAGRMAAQFTPDTLDDAVYQALTLIAAEKKFTRAVRAVAEALPQHRPAVVQQLFAEGI